MKRTLRCPVVLGVALLFLGCEEVPPPVQPTPIPIPISAPSAERSFSLWGFVGDTASRELAGSRIAVVDGRGVETVATTDTHGHFLLPGPFTGTLRITASHEGYSSQTKMYALPDDAPATGAQGSVSFGLELPGPSAQILGDFAVTLTADATCTSLPEDVRTRTYSTTLTNGEELHSFVGRLSGARFFPWTQQCPSGPAEECLLNRLRLGTAGDFVGGYMIIIEQLSDTSYLLVDGRIGGSISASGATVSLNGSLDFCRAEPVLIDRGTMVCPPVSAVHCYSQNHQVALSRR